MTGVRDVEAMGERALGKIGIDQGRRRARLDDTEPGDEIFRPVLHHQRNHVAAPEALALGPARIAVGRLVVLAVGDLPIFEIDRDIVRLGARQFHP